MPTATRPNKRLLAWSWLPAMAVVALSNMTAAGVSLVPNATSASSATVGVGGTIGVGASIDAVTGCAGPFDPGGGADMVLATANIAPGTCTVSVSTNAANGAYVDVFNDAGAANFFCTGGCAADQDVIGNGNPAPPYRIDGVTREDRFGMTLVGGTYGNGGGGSWVANAGADPAATAWYPVAAAAGADTDACYTTSDVVSGETCQFRFGANPAGDQNTGGYSGTVRFQVMPQP